MSHTDFFKILQTTSSEVSRPNLFHTWDTIHVPDLFVTLFFFTLLGLAVCLDIGLVFFFIFNYEWSVTLIFASTLFPHSICEFLFDRKNAYECVANYIPNRVFYSTFYILGFGSIFTTSRILMETFTITKTGRKYILCFPYPFFHISNESLSNLKIYCCIHLVLRSIPQLFIVSVIILDGYVTEGFAIILGINILLNILIFCQVMATTFPIRKTPRVFTSSTCVLLNALNKFMATMCACCVHLTVFAVVFKRHTYYAVLVILLKSLFWVIPCWRMLKAQTITKTCFAVYFICISLVFGFIYVHPFEGLGKLYYYLSYLLEFMYEIFIIYLVADANVESISYYLTLKILMFGFLSCFGLLNILHKYRENNFVLYVREKSQEVMNTEYKDVESNESKEDVQSNETPGTSKSVDNPENKGDSAEQNAQSNTKSDPKNNESNRNSKDTAIAESVEVYQEEKKLSKEQIGSRGFLWRWW